MRSRSRNQGLLAWLNLAKATHIQPECVFSIAKFRQEKKNKRIKQIETEIKEREREKITRVDQF